MELLKDRVAIYCAHTGATRESIARRIGMSTTSFWAKLNGKTEFKLSEAEALSKILGCSVDDLRREFTCR